MFTTEQNILESIFSSLLGLFLTASPFFIIAFLKMNRRKLNDKSFKTRFGTLYMNIDTSTMLALYNTLVYLVRRLVIAASIVYLGEYPAF